MNPKMCASFNVFYACEIAKFAKLNNHNNYIPTI